MKKAVSSEVYYPTGPGGAEPPGQPAPKIKKIKKKKKVRK